MKRWIILIALALAATAGAVHIPKWITVTDTTGIRKTYQDQYIYNGRHYVGMGGYLLELSTPVGGTLSASNITANETLGAELITGAKAMSTWTPVTAWTYASAKWSHATGTATALVSNWQPTASTRYYVSVTYTQSVDGTGVTPSMGGMTLPVVTAAGTYSYEVSTTATTALTFTPGSGGTWVGDITITSIKVSTNGVVTGTGLSITGPAAFGSTIKTTDSLGAALGIWFGNGIWSRGGNARGANSVDLQTYTRSAATQVASGIGAVLLGGRESTASGNYALSWGLRNAATGVSAGIVGGADITSSGTTGAAGGDGATNASQGGWSFGTGTVTSTALYQSARGRYASSTLQSEDSWSGFKFATSGDAQTSQFMLGDTTQNLSTSTTLALDGIVHTTFPIVVAGSCHYFEAMVIGKVISGTNAGASVAYKLTGVLDRTGATTTLYGYAQTVVYENAALAVLCDAVATADDTNDRLVITVTQTPDAATLMYWNARVVWVNVGG